MADRVDFSDEAELSDGMKVIAARKAHDRRVKRIRVLVLGGVVVTVGAVLAWGPLTRWVAPRWQEHQCATSPGEVWVIAEPELDGQRVFTDDALDSALLERTGIVDAIAVSGQYALTADGAVWHWYRDNDAVRSERVVGIDDVVAIDADGRDGLAVLDADGRASYVTAWDVVELPLPRASDVVALESSVAVIAAPDPDSTAKEGELWFVALTGYRGDGIADMAEPVVKADSPEGTVADAVGIERLHDSDVAVMTTRGTVEVWTAFNANDDAHEPFLATFRDATIDGPAMVMEPGSVGAMSGDRPMALDESGGLVELHSYDWSATPLPEGFPPMTSVAMVASNILAVDAEQRVRLVSEQDITPAETDVSGDEPTGWSAEPLLGLRGVTAVADSWSSVAVICGSGT